MSKSAKIWLSKIIRIFFNFFFIEEYQFRSTFFVLIISIFNTSPLHQFSKFNNFLWVCWFLSKNLSNFVTPTWKLDNPYYHNTYLPWKVKLSSNFIIGSISINWMQSNKKPVNELLPEKLRNWEFLPEPLKSFEPYDR